MKEKINIYTLSKKFEEKFNKKGRRFFAPSRINLIGEHIDYNGGKVLPCSIDIGTYAVCEKNDSDMLRLFSVNMNSGIDIPLDSLDYNPSYSWGNYIGGMAKYIKESGYNVGGLDIYYWGNIPNGAGLSSSASLEMLTGKIIDNLYNNGKIPPIEIVKIGQKVENEHLGLNTGIMDQFAINMGRENTLMLIDTYTLDFEYIDFDLEDNYLVILNTNQRRSLVDSKYNERHEECQKALKILQQYIDVDNLCQIDNLEYLNKIEDETLKKRARHVITENKRVSEMIKAVKGKDFDKMGRLLYESHQSLKEDYDVTGIHLDTIVEAAKKSKYTVGARMTGAGFAGCAIAIVKKDGIEEFNKDVNDYYMEKIGIAPDIIFSNVSGGTAEIA